MEFKLRLNRKFWIISTSVVVVFTGYIVIRNLGHAFSMWREIGRLEEERDRLQKQIAADSTVVENLKYDEYLEEYARNKFHMQQAGEEVFILED